MTANETCVDVVKLARLRRWLASPRREGARGAIGRRGRVLGQAATASLGEAQVLATPHGAPIFLSLVATTAPVTAASPSASARGGGERIGGPGRLRSRKPRSR